MKSLFLLAVVATQLSAQAAPQSAVSGKPLKLVQHSEYVGALVREPMIIDVPSAGRIVSGYNRKTPQLFRSTDQGKTWQPVNVETNEPASFGNSDVSLACSKDGTIYMIEMTYGRKAEEGTDINVAVSQNRGQSWHWHQLAHARKVDRPWIVVTPKGIAHAFWNDGDGVLHTMSADRGGTWSAPVRIINRGGSSHAAAGPHGELAVRVSPASASGNKFDPSIDAILISTDGAKTWKQIAAPGERELNDPTKNDSSLERWVEPLAWDDSDALYSLWTNQKGVWIARSTDSGNTWSQFFLHRCDSCFYPYLSASASGKLAATWFARDGSKLSWIAATIDFSGKGIPPVIHLSELQSIEAFAGGSSATDPQRPDTAGEYLPTLRTANGEMIVVVPIQNDAKRRNGFAFWRFEELH